jgi:hypothetical protein
MTPLDNIDAFLTELEQLTRKHKLKISACGCCESPWVLELEEKEMGKKYAYRVDERGEALTWSKPWIERPLPPEPEPEPDVPQPITEADTAKDRAVYDAWKAKAVEKKDTNFQQT